MGACDALSEEIAFNYGRSSLNVCVDRKITFAEDFNRRHAPSVCAEDANCRRAMSSRPTF